MKSHACFRVAADEVAKDFSKFLDLARTRTFEIYESGNVEILLVRIDAVRDWYNTLQIATPTKLLTDDERAALSDAL
jgi:hypothetical protein